MMQGSFKKEKKRELGTLEETLLLKKSELLNFMSKKEKYYKEIL